MDFFASRKEKNVDMAEKHTTSRKEQNKIQGEDKVRKTTTH